MPEILLLILQSLGGAFIGYALIRLLAGFFEKPEGSEGSVSSLLFAYFLLTALMALFVTQGKSTMVPALFFLLFFRRKEFLRNPLSGIRLPGIWLEFALLSFNILVHWLVFYDWKNGSFFSEWSDSYHYASNVTGILATRMECVMQECSNARLGLDAESTVYHYTEYYLAILLKWMLGKSSYFNLFFIAIPLIMTLAQVQAIRFLRQFSRLSAINVLGLVLGLSTCIRLMNIGGLWPGGANGLSHFPLFQISGYFNVYFYSYSGKIAQFMLLFFSLYALWKEKNMTLFGLAMMLVPMLNLTFFPFFGLYFGMLALAEKRPLRQLLPAAFLVPAALLPLLYLNFGKDLSIHALRPHLDFQLIVDGKQSLATLKAAWLFLMGNFYPHYLFFSLLLFLRYRKPIVGLFFLLDLTFPFLLNTPLVGSLLFLFGACLSLYFYVWSSRKSMPVFLVLLSLLLLQGLFGFFHPEEFRDVFQFKELPLIGLVWVMPLLIVTELQLSLSRFAWVAGVLFVAHNLYEMHFIHNRVYYRSTNSAEFTEAFQQKTSGKMLRAAYLTFTETNPVNAGLDDRCGFDLMNQSDSLELFYLGSDRTSRLDTLRMARGVLAWKILERQPFTIFRKHHPGISGIDSQRIAFMKQNGIRAFFRKDAGPRSKMQYLNPYLSDSLYNPTDKYWVYFLQFDKP